MQLLHKILNAKRKPLQMLFATVGFSLGFLFLLFAIQTYEQVQFVLKPTQAQYADYWIISKKVAVSNTLMMQRADFNNKEIDDLKNQSFIENVHPFEANQFNVIAYSKGAIPFLTEMFFEAVPDSVIDNKPDSFKWDENSDFVPVILSNDMLSLYNFGFAISKGLPQISKSTIGLLTIDIEISGKKGKKQFKSKIVGFSNRIPSVLVPLSFLRWANKNIGENKEIAPGRLLIKVKNPADAQVKAYFERKNYQLNEDKLQAGKVGNMLQIVMAIIGIIGLFFVVLAIVIFLMNFQLILAEAKEEVKLLLQLGYTTKQLQILMITRFLTFITILALIDFIVLWGTHQYYLIPLLTENGLEIYPQIFLNVWSIGIFVVILTIVSNYLSIHRLLKQYY